MADGVFNIARGRVFHYATLPSVSADALIVMLLQVSQADSALVDHDTFSAILAAANTEANFTNYARKSITSVTTTVDDSNDLALVDIADQTWTSAGGASNNTVVKTIIGYDTDTTAGTDANIVPLLHFDTPFTTDGGNVTLEFDADGIWQST